MRDVVLESPSGPVSARVYGVLSRGTDALVWVHGGSWTHGSVEAWHSSYEQLRRRLPITLVAARYCSSYQAPFPAQVVDVLAALQAVRNVIGVSATLLAGGDSAGGTLVAHSAASAPRLVDGQLLAYPPFDPTCSSAAYGDPTAFPSRERMRAAWAQYAGSTVPQALAAASPASMNANADLPPTSLVVGTSDPVRGDVESYAVQLEAAGVSVRLCLTDAVSHGDFLRPEHPDHDNEVHAWVARETDRHRRECTARRGAGR